MENNDNNELTIASCDTPEQDLETVACALAAVAKPVRCISLCLAHNSHFPFPSVWSFLTFPQETEWVCSEFFELAVCCNNDNECRIDSAIQQFIASLDLGNRTRRLALQVDICLAHLRLLRSSMTNNATQIVSVRLTNTCRHFRLVSTPLASVVNVGRQFSSIMSSNWDTLVPGCESLTLTMSRSCCRLPSSKFTSHTLASLDLRHALGVYEEAHGVWIAATFPNIRSLSLGLFAEKEDIAALERLLPLLENLSVLCNTETQAAELRQFWSSESVNLSTQVVN
jgi:hypothetical protein